MLNDISNRLDLSNVKYIDFDTSELSLEHRPGRLHWDYDSGTLEIGLEGGTVACQLGQELLSKVVNKTGTTLYNGQAVRITGAQGNRPTVTLALAGTDGVTNVFGVLTEDVEDNQEGYVTLVGLVHDVNTLGFPEGTEIFLSTEVAGAFRAGPPPKPYDAALIGIVITEHSQNGIIGIRPSAFLRITQLPDVKIDGVLEGDFLRYDSTAAVWYNCPFNPLEELGDVTSEPTGFPNRTDSIISFSDLTQSLTIQPTSTSYDYYIHGVKHTISSIKSLSVVNQGMNYFYLDSNNNLQVTSPFSRDILLKNNAYVASLYWDSTSEQHIYFGDERHGVVWDWNLHYYTHTTVGTRYKSGLDIVDSTAFVTIENIYNADNDLWNFSVIQTNINDFINSPNQNHTVGGSQSLSFINSEDGDIAQFNKGEYIDLSGYEYLNGWIYITSWGFGDNIQLYGYDTINDTIVGNSINLSSYITTSSYNTWQKFNIPLTDMGLSIENIDALRMEMVGFGAPPDGYIDDLYWGNIPIVNDSDLQFGVSSGIIFDEDLEHIIPKINKGENKFVVYYREGSDGRWLHDGLSSVAFKNIPGGRVSWNEYDAGVWKQSEVENDNYTIVHVFATNDVEFPIIGVQSQTTFTTLSSSRSSVINDISNILTGDMPFEEFLAVGSIIIRSSDNILNSYYASFVYLDTSNTTIWQDFRGIKGISTGGTSITDHGNLSGLLDDDHQQYHTDARGDARYSLLNHDLGTHGDVVLTNLQDKDFIQYDSTSETFINVSNIDLIGTESIIDEAVTNDKILSIDAAKIISGYLNPDIIQDQSIVISKINSTDVNTANALLNENQEWTDIQNTPPFSNAAYSSDPNNLVLDPDFTRTVDENDDTFWELIGPAYYDSTAGFNTTPCIRFESISEWGYIYSSSNGNRIYYPARVNDKFYFRIRAKVDADYTGYIYLRLSQYDKDGTYLGYDFIRKDIDIIATEEWVDVYGWVKCTKENTISTLLLIGNYGTSGGNLYIDNVYISRYEKEVTTSDTDSNNLTTIAYPNGGSLNLTATQTGALKITLPNSWTNTMIRVVVDVMQYNDFTHGFSLDLFGYTYIGGSNWTRTSVQLLGNIINDTTVRFAHDGNKCTILIGDLDSEWYYPMVKIRLVSAAFNNYNVDMWYDGWSVSLETTSYGSVSKTTSNVLIDANAVRTLVGSDLEPAEVGADVTLNQLSGSGVNIANYPYTTWDGLSLPSFGVNITTIISQETTNGYFNSKCLKITATGTNAYCALGKFTTDYNVSISPNKKWILSAYVRSSITACQVQLYIRTSDGVYSTPITRATSATPDTWTRISGVVDLSSNSSNMCLLRVDNDGGAGSVLLVDGFMLEEMIGNNETPSAYVRPAYKQPDNIYFNTTEAIQIQDGGSIQIQDGGSLDMSSGSQINLDNTSNITITPVSLLPDDASIYLGGSTNRFKAVYAVNGTIQTSDERYKQNIKNISPGIDLIERVNAINFDYNDMDIGKTKDGFSAQELVNAMKDLYPDEELGAVYYDETNDVYGINYGELVPVLWKAIQQLNNRIKELENK